MATYVRGNEVTKTTDGTAVTKDVNYELFEKNSDGTYTSLGDTEPEINFEVSALGLAAGNHTLVVQAHADGYESSDYSNEEVYTVEGLPIVNLYNAADYPVGKCTYSITPGINTSNTKVVEGKRGSTSAAYGMEIYQFPVEAGKTYSVKLYNAPTTATTVGYDTDSDGTLENSSEISYFGLYGVVFYETIDGVLSIRYVHSNVGTGNTHFTAWNTSKQPTYTGDLEISDSSTPNVFSISSGYNSDKVVITNLTTGTKTSDVTSSIFGTGANLFTQSAQITINDEAITHMTLLWGNPSDSLYQMGRVAGNSARVGVLSAEDQAAAYETLENGLVIVEGNTLPENYVPYTE